MPAMRSALPLLLIAVGLVVMGLMVANPWLDSDAELVERRRNGHRVQSFRVDMDAFLESSSIPEIAESVGKVVMVGTPDYERAKTKARQLANEVRETREYQIDLDKYLWQYDREDHARSFLAYLNEITRGKFEFDYDDYRIDYYHRYSHETEPKTFSKGRNGLATVIVRVRDFLGGDRAGTTTIDMKFRGGESHKQVEDWPTQPGEAFLPSRAVQKIEQDVHACDIRWSKATRVFLDHPYALDSIQDLLPLFPQFTDIPGITPDLPLHVSGMNVYYWQASAVKTLENGLHYKSTFTLMYNNIEDAMNGTAKIKKDGEWSIRLYSGMEGFSPEYVPTHLDMVNDLFEEVLFSEWNVDEEMECMYGEDGERLPFHRL